MLENTVQIEGLDRYQDHELFEDTPPSAVLTTFFVKSEVMPFLSEQAGYEVRKNFVHVRRTFEMGRSEYSRRINDEVEFDESKQRWVVKRLQPGQLSSGPVSDIRRNPNEWNAFARGSDGGVLGTPLSMLFPNDPSLVEFYVAKQVRSIEQLSALNETNQQELGGMSRQHVAAAKSYLARMVENADAVKATAALAEKDRRISALEGQLLDLTEKLNLLLESQGENKKVKRTKKQEEILEA